VTSPAKTATRLRDQMAKDGFAVSAIVTALTHTHHYRPRIAWRLACGLSQSAAADQYNVRFGTATRAPMSASRISAYERWPGRGERPAPGVLCGLAEVYGARPADLVDDLDLRHTPEPDLRALRDLLRPERDTPAPASPEPGPDIEYRQTQSGSDDSGSTHAIWEIVTMAAHEGSEHAEHTERRDIGDTTLEQLRADVVRLSHEYLTAEPFPTFQEMRRVRRRMHAALDRRIWPRDQSELYFLLGVLNGLMAAAANGLGHAQAAEELVRAGWVYATAIDHRPLLAQLRIELAGIAYWERPRHSRDLAASGLRYLSDGPNAAQLHLQYGRAAARLGDAEAARRSITAAHEARARDHHDDLLEIGGELVLSLASQHYLAGAGLVEVPGAWREAIAELEQATSLYAAGPGPGEQHSGYCVAIAHIDLATARLRDSQLDAAASALEPVLALRPNRRIASLPQRLHRVRAELAAPAYQGQVLAAEVDERIEVFCQETIVADLEDLPAGP
jgi:transcriptional regulator with XRE-family HTH domain